MHTPLPDDLDPPAYRPWLHRFCYLVILATFALIAIGGKVTSYDVGMAVPDGFTTFGHITFLAPLSTWWHDFGTRWEHSHRLQGNLVGVLTIIMAFWLWQTQSGRPWLKLSGLSMLLLVISQGIMGALRVSEISLTLAFVHGIVGQLILCSWIVIAVALSRPWINRLAAIAKAHRPAASPKLRWAVRLLLVGLIAQLTLGAAVRHFKADKASPDFPLTYGHVLPPMSQDQLDQWYVAYYTKPMGITAEQAVEAGIVSNRSPQGEIVVSLGKVHLHYAHRTWAYVLTLGFLGILIAVFRGRLRSDMVVPPVLALAGLFALQICLGVFVVYTGTDPLIATAHQATGALLIATATWLAVRVHLAEYDPPAEAGPAQPNREPNASAEPARLLSNPSTQTPRPV